MKTWSELFKVGMVGTMALILMAACGKKDDGPAAPPAVVANPCAGQVNGATINGQYCQNGLVQIGGNGYILNNVEFQTDHFRGSLSLSGTAPNINYLDPLLPNYYAGPVILSGTLTTASNYCGIPSQAYTITGTANYFKGALTGIKLLAGALQLWGNNATISNSGEFLKDAPGMRIYFWDAQTTVNNQPCFY